MSIPQHWRAAAFAKKRPAASISACGGPVSHVASLPSGRRSNAQYPLRSGLWHPLNVSLPPRPPPSGGLQHGFGPASCAVLLKAHFDKRLTPARAATLVVKRAAQQTGRQPYRNSRFGARGSGMFKECQSLVGGIP